MMIGERQFGANLWKESQKDHREGTEKFAGYGIDQK